MKETIYLLESLPGTFKVGRTDRGFSKRYSEYQIAGGILAVCVVANCVRAEGDLIRAMKDTFGPPVSGAETFAGDYATAIAIFLRISSGHIVSRFGLPQRPIETDYSEFLAAIGRGDHISAAILLDEGVRRYIEIGRNNIDQDCLRRLKSAWFSCLKTGNLQAAKLMRINGYDYCSDRMQTWGAAVGWSATMQWLLLECDFSDWLRDDLSHLYELARRGDTETVAWILRNVVQRKGRHHSKQIQCRLFETLIDSRSKTMLSLICSREFFAGTNGLPIDSLMSSLPIDIQLLLRLLK